jgi:hypothetical protein
MHCYIDVYSKATDMFAVKRKMQHIVFSYMTVIINNMSQVHYSYFIILLNLTLDTEGFNNLTFLRLSHCLQLEIFR